jgi:hypothetical protein
MQIMFCVSLMVWLGQHPIVKYMIISKEKKLLEG